MVLKTCKQLFEDKNWRDEFMFSYITLMRGVLDHDFDWVEATQIDHATEIDVKAQLFVLWSAPLVAWTHEQLKLNQSSLVTAKDVDYLDPLYPASRVSFSSATSDEWVSRRSKILADLGVPIEWFPANTSAIATGVDHWSSAFQFDYSVWIRLLIHRQLMKSQPLDATVGEVATLVSDQLGNDAAWRRLLVKIESLRTGRDDPARIRNELDQLLVKLLYAVEESLAVNLASNPPQGNAKVAVLGREAGGFYGDWVLDLNELELTIRPGPSIQNPTEEDIFIKSVCLVEGEPPLVVPPRIEFPRVLALCLNAHTATPISSTKMAQYVKQLADVAPLVSQMIADFCDSQYIPDKDLGKPHIDAIRGLWSCLFRYGIVRRLPAEGLAELRKIMKQTPNINNFLTAPGMVGVLEEDRINAPLIPQRDERWSYYLPSDKSGADRLEDRITSASHYLFESYLSPTTPFQLLSAMIACEAIFGKNETELSKSISEMAAVALEPDVDFRVEAILAIRALYNLRSRIVHGAQVGVTGIDVSVARTIAIGLLLQAISFRQQFKGVHGPDGPDDSKEMFRELEHCKIRGDSPTGALSWRSVRRIWMTKGQYNDPKNHQQNP